MKLTVEQRKAIKEVSNKTIMGINVLEISLKIKGNKFRKTAINCINRDLRSWLKRIEQEGL